MGAIVGLLVALFLKRQVVLESLALEPPDEGKRREHFLTPPPPAFHPLHHTTLPQPRVKGQELLLKDHRQNLPRPHHLTLSKPLSLSLKYPQECDPSEAQKRGTAPTLPLPVPTQPAQVSVRRKLQVLLAER